MAPWTRPPFGSFSILVNSPPSHSGIGRIVPFHWAPRSGRTLGARLFASAVTQGRFRTTHGGKDLASTQQLNEPMETIDKTVQVMTSAFVGDPVYTWFLSDSPASEHKTILPKFFRAFFVQALLNNGVFIEAGDFGSCGLVMPPGSRLENPWTLLQAGLVPALWAAGLGTFKRAMFEYSGGVRPILEQCLTREERENHWYGVVMGTALNRRRQGLGSSVFLNMQDHARSDGRPLCFEAATARNRDLYLRHGSRIVGEFTVGKGKVGADGMPKKQGEGILIWSMVWRP